MSDSAQRIAKLISERDAARDLSARLAAVLLDGDWLQRQVVGSLRSTIDAHGPITHQYITSAAKRVAGQITGSARNDLRSGRAPLRRLRTAIEQLEQCVLQERQQRRLVAEALRSALRATPLDWDTVYCLLSDLDDE